MGEEEGWEGRTATTLLTNSPLRGGSSSGCGGLVGSTGVCKPSGYCMYGTTRIG